MIDVVYPFKYSRWKDNELRYSLRSLEMHVLHRNVFIVGSKPEFLTDAAIHIYSPSNHPNPAVNIMSHLFSVCQDERLSDEFLMVNDDYFFTAPLDPETYPFYYKCDLEKTVKINKGNYRRHAEATLKVLQERRLPTLNFDTHWPIRFNKEKLLEVINSYPWGDPFGLIMKSLYCNTLRIEGEQRDDCKVYADMPVSHWRKYADEHEVFSVENACLTADFRRFLQERFPEKSKYES